MLARLVALNGTSDIPLIGLLTIAGRHPGCDFRLESSRVSRRHCCLAVGSGEVLVRDLGSTNGTWINDRRVEEGVLRPGDVLGIAHLRFRLALPGSAAAGIPAGRPHGPQSGPVFPSTESVEETALHDRTPSGQEAPATNPPGPA